MKIGNAMLTVDGDILSMYDDRGVGTTFDRAAAAGLWPPIKRFAETGSLVPEQGDEKVAGAPANDPDDRFILGFVHAPVQRQDAFVFGRCYRRNDENMAWLRLPSLDRGFAVDIPLIVNSEAHRYHEIVEFLRLRAKERETDAKIDRLERAQMDAAAQAAANRLPEHDSLVAAATSPTSPTAWVLANKHGAVLTRFCGFQQKPTKAYEIAFFDSEEEAEGVHDAMGLRGTVRPQLVNRRTLEPVT